MELALRGILIGLSLGAPIGPINVEIVRRGLRSGFLSGWLVGAGAITGDTLYCLLVIAGISPIIQHAAVKTILWTAGAAFLCLLAYGSLRAALSRRHLLETDGSVAERRSYATGLLMALFNPMG
ncbi:MAG: LysE family transporter, partial [Thermomicrobiaceae bacterium]|nr:LysE family transporter [Thermomicrobiaceae bacterium]